MKKFLVLALGSIACFSAADQVVFYGGDFNAVNGLASENNAAGTHGMVYDDFQVSQNYNLTGIFANFLDNSNPLETTANVEIRTGVSSGNGGTLVYSSAINVTATATGRSGFGFTEYDLAGAASGLTLVAGTTYWVGMSPNNGSGSDFLSTTNGANGVGGPLNDGNSFFNSSSFGANFTDTSTQLGGTSGDFSIGVRGSAVPEPASVAVLGIGALALIRRRRAAKK